MKYLKTINVLDGATDQPSRLRTSKWIEINNKSKGKYDNSNIRFKTSNLVTAVMHTYLLKEL